METALILGSAAFGLIIGLYLRDPRGPWVHDYIQSSFKTVGHLSYTESGGRIRGVAWPRARKIEILADLSPELARHTKRHEEAHVALHDIEANLVLGDEEEEAIADVVALAMAIECGDVLINDFSHSVTDEPEEVLLSLGQIFECMRLARHLHNSTRSSK